MSIASTLLSLSLLALSVHLQILLRISGLCALCEAAESAATGAVIIKTSNCITLVDPLKIKSRPEFGSCFETIAIQQSLLRANLKKTAALVCVALSKRGKKGCVGRGRKSMYRWETTRALDSNFEPIAREIALSRLKQNDGEKHATQVRRTAPRAERQAHNDPPFSKACSLR